MARAFGRAFVASIALIVTAAPAGAQHYSDSYTFLKAVKERDADKVTTLLAEPGTVVVNAKDRSSGEAALHVVTRARDYTWLSFLLGKRAKADIVNNQGETPLMIASQIGWTDGAELLLAQGASVDLGNQRGETPLIMAVHKRDMQMVGLLLRKGANPARKDNLSGYSALDYARQDPRALAMVKLLEAKPGSARPTAGPRL